MTHDFNAALSSMSDRSDWVEENWNTIIAALRIADKLMQEPSDEIGWIGMEFIEGKRLDYPCNFIELFEKQRDQILRELNISTEPVSIPSAADTSQNVEYS